MTREEAIEMVEIAFDVYEEEYGTGNDWSKQNKARNMAIKALEQESCEYAVSRKGVVEYIKASDAELGHDSENELVVEDILNMPPVTHTRKKGKWENGNPICPCCGEDKFKGLDADVLADWKPKYCPNCGAEMESE